MPATTAQEPKLGDGKRWRGALADETVKNDSTNADAAEDERLAKRTRAERWKRMAGEAIILRSTIDTGHKDRSGSRVVKAMAQWRHVAEAGESARRAGRAAARFPHFFYPAPLPVC
mmetsp:Transcript_1613/g.3103  ORF Transcript_1613/g.3103 Transcript_1613/m.3103 type:complete len:116 (+) Transcript_1613:2025-2372(+)